MFIFLISLCTRNWPPRASKSRIYHLPPPSARIRRRRKKEGPSPATRVHPFFTPPSPLPANQLQEPTFLQVTEPDATSAIIMTRTGPIHAHESMLGSTVEQVKSEIWLPERAHPHGYCRPKRRKAKRSTPPSQTQLREPGEEPLMELARARRRRRKPLLGAKAGNAGPLELLDCIHGECPERSMAQASGPSMARM